MRDHPRLAWIAGEAWPMPRGPLSSRTIRMQHFRSRDPVQLQARLAIRENAARAGQRKTNHHWRVASDNWQTLIVPAADCHYDAQDGQYVIDTPRFAMSRGKQWRQWPRRLLTLLGLRV